MEINAGPNDWALNDEQNWAAFLATETGRRIIPRLLEVVPGLLETGDTNAILIRTGVVRGFQIVVQELVRMTQTAPPPVSPKSNLPALEDDEAWNDGQKIDPNLQTKHPVLEPDFFAPAPAAEPAPEPAK